MEDIPGVFAKFSVRFLTTYFEKLAIRMNLNPGALIIYANLWQIIIV